MVKTRTDRVAWLLLLPALVIFLLFLIYPLLWAARASLTHLDPTTPESEAAYFYQYGHLLQSAVLWRAVINTMYFSAIFVPGTLLLALGLALLLHRRLPASYLLRFLFSLPYILPVVAGSAIWRWLYDPSRGILNAVLHQLGIGASRWLQEPILVLPSIAITCIWHNAGFFAVIFLLGLRSIPPALYETARLDGASAGSIFWHVSLPSLRRTVMVSFILLVITGQKLFQEVYVMAGDAGPANWALTIPYLIYRYVFVYHAFDVGAALSVILLAVVVVMELVQRRFVGVTPQY